MVLVEYFKLGCTQLTNQSISYKSNEANLLNGIAYLSDSQSVFPGVTWKLVRNVASWALPRPTDEKLWRLTQ